MRSIVKMLVPKRTLILLVAGSLIVISILQRPSTMLGLLTPKGMAAMTVRVFVGFLLACTVRASLRQSTWRAGRSILARPWNLVPAFLMLVTLILMYTILGDRAFTGLRLGDLVMHRAFLTQILAFAVLWFATLR